MGWNYPQVLTYNYDTLSTFCSLESPPPCPSGYWDVLKDAVDMAEGRKEEDLGWGYEEDMLSNIPPFQGQYSAASA